MSEAVWPSEFPAPPRVCDSQLLPSIQSCSRNRLPGHCDGEASCEARSSFKFKEVSALATTEKQTIYTRRARAGLFYLPKFSVLGLVMASSCPLRNRAKASAASSRLCFNRGSTDMSSRLGAGAVRETAESGCQTNHCTTCRANAGQLFKGILAALATWESGQTSVCNPRCILKYCLVQNSVRIPVASELKRWLSAASALQN